VVDDKCKYNVFIRKPEGKRPLGKNRLDGNAILKWISTGLDCLGYRVREHGNKHLRSINFQELLDQMSECKSLEA